MSSCDRERTRISESLEFPIKSEVEESFPLSAVRLENKDISVNSGLFDDCSLFKDPGMEFKAEPDIEFKAEPEIFESSEGDMKYSFNCGASVNEEGLQISKREINKEEESVKTVLKEECGIQLGSGRKEVKRKARGKGEEHLRIEEQMKNSCCEKPLCQERDSKTHTNLGTREKSFMGGRYKEQFNGVVNPNTHLVIHTGGQFRCKEYGKTFSKQSNLKARYETHSRRRSFKCSDCGKVFRKKSNLITHLRTHTGEKPFKCDVCSKAFSEKGTLTEHYRIHTGEKPFKCSVCDKAFSQASNLTTHYRIHTGEKPFKCSVCNKAFSEKGTLKEHYRIHTGEKPFKCSICDKAFSQASNLTTHYRIHTEAPSPRTIQHSPQVANGGTPSL